MLEINNLTNFVLDKRSFSTVAKKVLKGENKETKTLSLAFVEKEEIKKLNKKFRKKDKATDVLSFELSDEGGHAFGGKGEDYLGEIIICPEVVKENSLKHDIDFKEEIVKVLVHGILHLCGYDHEKSQSEADAMRKKEKFYLNKIHPG